MNRFNIKKLTKSQCFFAFTLLVEMVFFFCMQYGDSLITAMHSINFWDCLFSGNIRNFYAQNTDALLSSGVYYGNYSAYYDFGIYIIFAIWVFPLWLGQKILK